MAPENAPHQSCLIPNIPQDVQRIVSVVTNFVLVPLNLLLAVMSFVINLLVLTAVARTRSLHHPALLMLCSLSITDLFWAMYSMVVDFSRITHEEFCPEHMAAFARTFSVFCYLSTMANLAIISKDRHFAVTKPNVYRGHHTRSLVLKKVSFIRVFSLVMLILAYISEYVPRIYPPLRAAAVLVYVISIATIIYSYVGIFIANKRHRHAMGQHEGQMLAALKHEKKLANTIGLILIVLCFTFPPALFAPLVLALQGFSGSDFVPFRPFYTILITLNGLLNPLLNYGRNENVRVAVHKLIKGLRCIARVQPGTTEHSQQSSNSPPKPETVELRNTSEYQRWNFEHRINSLY